MILTKFDVRDDSQTVEIVVKGESLLAHRNVLTAHCEYFKRCLKATWSEGQSGVIRFDDIEPRYLALFIGVAYSHSSIMPLPPPVSSPNPQARSHVDDQLRDFVEVYKLCDRFVSPRIAEYMVKCIYTSIGDGHRALFRSPGDEGLQKWLMQAFADGYEALELTHPTQKEIGEKLVQFFCEGISYTAWENNMEEVVADRPRFVSSVSKGFANRLATLERRMKRRELKGP